LFVGIYLTKTSTYEYSIAIICDGSYFSVGVWSGLGKCLNVCNKQEGVNK
jgi:hypothetical protein